MLLLRHKPLPPLSDFVDVLWLCDDYAVSHEKERLLPDGTVELVINLKEDRIRIYDSHNAERYDTIPGCVVSGPRSEFFVIDTEGESATVGVHFKPGGAFPFLNLPPSELNNQSVALEWLWGTGSNRLRERLLEAPTAEKKFRALECCLLEQLAKPLEHHPVVAFALQQFFGPKQPPPVSRVVEQVGFSQRRFIQLFSDEVGLTPKLFCRVSRFQKVIQTANAGGEIDWAQVALDCGYYDQPHFIHDFQAFAGISPSEYLERRTEHVNHVPMAE
jgi:AraC-like DNA-binding protein